ncbi:MAG: transposase [Balneolaceae bacterium]|nr:transposase [Balneolaceae bacterium]
MFRKSPKHPQIDLLSSAGQHLDERRQRQLRDPHRWHNSFYEHVFSQIDESIFHVLFDDQMGAPNAPVRQLVGMMILKDGFGFSDEQLFEACRFHLLFRQALGLVNLNDPPPTESTYYLFRKRIYEYDREHGTDLLGRVFGAMTSDQLLEFDVGGQKIRMDSKLIGSNIASFSRFELVCRTLKVFWRSLSEQAQEIAPQSAYQAMQELAAEDAQSTVYRSTHQEIQQRLEDLGGLVASLLDTYSCEDSSTYDLLKQVFTEQYTIDEDDDDSGQVSARDTQQITADSIQSPDDPECSYRRKGGQAVKGYTVNLTETIDEEQELQLITDVHLAPADCSDTDMLAPAIEATEQRTGRQVDTCYADGAYNRSIDKDQEADQQHVEMVLSGIQGAPSRFELTETEQGVTVYDTKTGNTHPAEPARRQKNSTEQRWRIRLDESQPCRYFGQSAIRASARRQAIAERPASERNKRNNVEASIWHLTHTLRSDKTCYRGLIKHKLWAWCRAIWVNMRRIQRYISQLDESGEQTQHYTPKTAQIA